MFITSKHVFHQILATIPVTLQDFMIGAGCGWSSPILNSYKNSGNEFSPTEEDCSWIASLHYAGRAIGCLFSAKIVDRFGRISLLSISSILTLLIWIGVLLTKNIFFHYSIRFIFGLSIGAVDTAMPIYIAENSSPDLRGLFGNVISLFFFAGELLAFVVATYTSYEIVALALSAFATINLASAFLFREPAQFLIMKGKEDKAKTRFLWLRGNDEHVITEFDQMKVKLANMKVRFSWGMFLDRRFKIVAIINILAYLTGFPALNALLAFALIPTSSYTSNELTILYGVAQLIGIFLSSIIIERYGRRTLFIASLTICLAANSVSAILHCCLAYGIQVPNLDWLLFASTTIYSTVFAAFIFSLIAIARGELLPPEFKAAGICATVILNSASGFLASNIFLPIANTFGMQTNFIIFTIITLIMLVYVYLFLPETRGMTLMEIQKLFED